MAPVVVEPLVLLANADKWLTESLESVLTQSGYRVIATAKRQQVLELARRQQPDGILLDVGLDQRASDNLALCRALRADPSVSRATPIIITTAGPALRAQQIEALRAGAWELRGDPLDVEELVLRLGVYVQGKLEVDRLGAEGLVDRASGLYNDVGMTRRSAELAAFTAGEGLPLACSGFPRSESATASNRNRPPPRTYWPPPAARGVKACGARGRCSAWKCRPRRCRAASANRCSARDACRWCAAWRAGPTGAPARWAGPARSRTASPNRSATPPSALTSSPSRACGRS